MQGRLANPRLRIVQHAHQFAERLWHQEVVQQRTAVVTNIGILVS